VVALVNVDVNVDVDVAVEILVGVVLIEKDSTGVAR